MLGRIIYVIGGVIETLVALRFALRLLGANPDNGLVQTIYTWSTPFVAPFAGIFGRDASVVTTQGAVTASVFDWTVLVALIIIGLIVGLLGNLLAPRYRY